MNKYLWEHPSNKKELINIGRETETEKEKEKAGKTEIERRDKGKELKLKQKLEVCEILK
jgi:hypothetical protein